ncbi:excinuclease ABC subunit C, partial [Morganella morganii]|nr:excinuclease ABC subunit C [Morganella morganii]
GDAAAPDSQAMQGIQHKREESKTRAITGNRQRREKMKNTRAMEAIEGIGTKRRQMLRKYMGGLQQLRNASIDESAKGPTISYALAEKIFHALKN